jgi:LacI family transcriptional regulator
MIQLREIHCWIQEGTLSLADESDQAVIRAVRTAGIPVVLIERDLPLDVDSVGTDHRSSIRGAVEYLFTLGHRRIALITGGQTNRAGRERLGGFVDAFREANVAIDPAMLRLESLSSDYGFRETQALLKLQEPPSAIIAGGNLMLAGVLRAAHLLNVRVPQELSIISSGDTELAELATPPVTAVRWDLAAGGRDAASLMLGRLGGTRRSEPTRIEVSFEIVLRKSCAPISAH